MSMNVAVILPAAGASTRFGKGSKIEADLGGRPVFLRSVELFTGRKDVAQIILAVNPDTIDAFNFRWADRLGFHGVKVVPGGKTERWETVQRALEAVGSDATHVAIHDAARPLTTKALIDRVFLAAESFDAVIPGMSCSATLKRVGPADDAPLDPLDAILGESARPPAQRVVATVDRRDVVEVQTPQVFKLDLLRRAYEKIDASVTDDAALVEALGEPVYVVEGEATNLKITRPGDMELAGALVQQRDAAGAKEMAAKKLFLHDDDE